jgi:hypothetical protein
MKSYKRTVGICLLALTALVSGFYSSVEAQQIPSSAVACYFVGRAYLNSSGQGEVVGYFTDITGIGASDTLFSKKGRIALGRDFRSALQKTLASCDLMLVLIGRNWADVKDEEGRTRLRKRQAHLKRK